MEYISALLLIVIFAVINRMRGWEGFGNKVMTSALAGFVAGGYYALTYLTLWPAIAVALSIFAGLWLWSAPGWGDYWDGTDKPNDEIHIIDKIARKLFKPGVANDTFSMALRGLFGYPIFIALSWLNPWSLLVGLGMSLQGAIYILTRNLGKWHVPVSEVIMGALIGLLIIIVL